MDRDRPATASRIEFQSSRTATSSLTPAVLIILLTMIVPACSHDEGPELAPVTGKVTYQGKPITQGTISFQPVSPDGTPATGSIGTDGSLHSADRRRRRGPARRLPRRYLGPQGSRRRSPTPQPCLEKEADDRVPAPFEI